MRKDAAPAMFSAGSSRRKKAVPAKFKENMRKHRNIILIAVAAVVIIALLLILFTGGNDDPLLGKWSREESNGTTTLEFLPDGTLNIYAQLKNVKSISMLSATYAVDEDKITITINEIKQTGKFKINENKLTITQTGTKETQVYVRQ